MNGAEFDILVKPRITEKGNMYEEMRKYCFTVSPKATKSQVKKAFEKIFKSKVSSVNIINVAGKKKIFKGRKGIRNSLRKAIITMADAKKIDIMKGV